MGQKLIMNTGPDLLANIRSLLAWCVKSVADVRSCQHTKQFYKTRRAHPLMSAVLPDLRSIPGQFHCREASGIVRHSWFDWFVEKDGMEIGITTNSGGSITYTASAAQPRQRKGDYSGWSIIYFRCDHIE